MCTRYPDADDGTERSKRSDTQHRSRHGDRCRARAGVARVVVPFEVCGDVTCPVCGSPVLIYYNILYGVFGIGIYSKRLEGPTAPPPHADTYMYPCVPYLKIPTFRVGGRVYQHIIHTSNSHPFIAKGSVESTHTRYRPQPRSAHVSATARLPHLYHTKHSPDGR